MIALLVTLVTLTLLRSTPIVFAALGGVISERSGVVNIALEGMMAAGAFSAVYVSYLIGSPDGNVVIGPIVALFAGILVGASFGLLLGLASTIFKVDQIVAGIGLNLLCPGIAAVALYQISTNQTSGVTAATAGSLLNQVNSFNGWVWALVVLAGLCAVGLHWLIYRTPWGLRVQACGENPHAVKSAGLDPLKLRIMAVTISGALAGLAGAFLSIGEVNQYTDGMTGGRGFIALAAIIFGRWTPLGATGAAIFFGFFEALEIMLQGVVGWLPSDALSALPYLAALVALCGIAGRVRAPAADGVPY